MPRPDGGNRVDVVVRIAGNSQDGIQLIGQLLATLTGRSDMDVITFQTFPSTISGGASIFQVRLGAGRVRSAGDDADVLLAFYQHSYEEHISFLREGGVLLYDSDQVGPNLQDARFRYIGVPITSLTVEAIGGTARDKGKNMFALGLVTRMLSLDEERLEALLRERLGGKGEEAFSRALTAFRAGHAHELADVGTLLRVAPQQGGAHQEQITLNGNQAIAYGALAAGVRFGAGYPITPWSSIMETLRAELPKFGGVFVQAEDEIAAVSMAIGASYADRVAITGTSGPGLSLKVEALGFAVAAEVGLVIVDVQRGGPSTGLPTKVEQSDLNLAVFGGHGDAPRVVLAPSTIAEAFYTTIEAVNIARHYNVPVILLTDQLLSTRISTMPLPAVAQVAQEIGPELAPRRDAYLPYRDTESGVSPRCFPGTYLHAGAYPVITGLEHNEAGHPDGTAANHRRMVAKRRRKLVTLMNTLPRPKLYGAQAGEVLFVSWGTSCGPVEEAVDRLLADGHQVGSIRMKYLNPLPNGLDEMFARFRHVFVVELNDQGLYGYGQLAQLLRARYADPRIRGINKTDGLPFKVREIIGEVTGYLVQAVNREAEGVTAR